MQQAENTVAVSSLLALIEEQRERLSALLCAIRNLASNTDDLTIIRLVELAEETHEDTEAFSALRELGQLIAL